MADAQEPLSPPGKPSRRFEGDAAQMTSPLDSALPHIRQTLHREPALVITFAYLLLATAGIFYNYRFYQKFDIPILSLSQISDFLVGGIQQPIAPLLVLTTFPLLWLMDRWNLRTRHKEFASYARLLAAGPHSRWQRLRLAFFHWRRRQWPLQLSYVLIVVLYGWAFVGMYAKYRASAVKLGDAAEVRIWLSGENAAFAPVSSPSWTYLGATGSYVFVYDPAAERAVILPVENIARIEPLPRQAAPHAALAPDMPR